MTPPTAPHLAAGPVRPRSASLALALLLAAGSGAAVAQEAEPAAPTRIEEAERVLPRVNRDAPVVTPTRTRVAQPVRPGLTGGEDWGEGIDLRPAGLPEGTFLIERPGRIVQGPGGRRIFVPTGTDRRAGEGPMLILPSATLERLELALTEAGDEPGVRVSGETFVYHGRSHLLLTSALMGEGDPAAETPAEPAADAPAGDDAEPAAEINAEPGEPASVLDDPDVRGLLEELEAARPTTTPDPRAQPGAPSPAEPVAGGVPPVPDGTPVVRRRGRLVRTGEGAWAFVFDNDPDDPLGAESMVVMPCLLLQRMERQALSDGDAHQLTVSGRIHTHQGQAYLLPTMMLRVPVTGVVPMQ
jgi:hypothetical protein